MCVIYFTAVVSLQSIIYMHNLIRPYISNITNRSHALTSQQILCVALVSLQMEVFFIQCRRCRALEQGNCMQGGQKSVPRPETDIIKCVFHCCGGGGGGGGDDGDLNSEVIIAYGVSDCSAILDCWKVHTVALLKCSASPTVPKKLPFAKKRSATHNICWDVRA